MRYISIFSGIEAASVAWGPLGWTPLCFSEVDAFPSAILANRFPDVPNLGDITKIDWSPYRGAVDVVVGGSPCQSFSVAGGRDSLDGESRLMFEYVRAIDEVRPRFFLWENVPGALVTKDNAFGQLLGEMERIGYKDVSWRVLDAMFFGVPQRRRRLFLVGHLGEGFSSAAVLFEREGLFGDSPSSKTKREELAADAGRGASGDSGDGCLTPWDVQSRRVFSDDATWPALYAGEGGGHGYVASSVYGIRTSNTKANGIGVQEELAHTLGTTDRDAICFKWFAGKAARTMPAYDDGTTPTLTNSDGHIPAVMYTDEMIVLAHGQANAEITMDGTSPTLTCLHEQPIVIDRAAYNQGVNAQYVPHIEQTETMDTLVARGPHAVSFRNGRKYVVRRLTPVECERLQGFPDHWTDLTGCDPDKTTDVVADALGVEGKDREALLRKVRKWSKACPDGPRYKCTGNSFAVPVVRWIGERIQMVDALLSSKERHEKA